MSTVLAPVLTILDGAKKVHNWSVEELPDLFRTTRRVKTQEVTKSRGERCGDIEFTDYLTNVVTPVALVLDLRITL